MAKYKNIWKEKAQAKKTIFYKVLVALAAYYPNWQDTYSVYEAVNAKGISITEYELSNLLSECYRLKIIEYGKAHSMNVWRLTQATLELL